MSDYTDAVLAKYPDVSAAIRKALADALAAAEKAQPGTPVGVSDHKPMGAQASESAPAFVRPDVALAAAADALVLAEEGLGYGEAMDRALADDPALADAYARRWDSRRSPMPTLPIPRGQRLIDRPSDVELADRSKARAEKDNVTFAEAMTLVLAEDPALKSRYMDFTSRHSALDELAYRVETIQAAARGRDHITEAKAVSLALSEDPMLKDSVFCYFERT